MTRAQALAKLRETCELSTGMLEPLGIGFESWLTYCQLPDEHAKRLISKFIAHFEARPA